MLPEVSELGRLLAWDVAGHRYPRQLDDAALDGIHHREVAHGPGEQGPLGIAGATEKEGCRRQVNNPCDAELALDGVQTGDPQPCSLVVLCRLFLVIAF